jgi:signal transduction histidine kinase
MRRALAVMLAALLMVPPGAWARGNTERELGREFYLEARSQLPLSDDPALSDWLNGLGGRLVEALGPQEFDYHFFPVESGMLNAFAVPGGYVFVFTGLIARASTEDEVAGVLGHEIGHVNAHHVTRLQSAGAMWSVASLLGMLLAAVNPVLAAGAMAAAQTAQLKYSRDFEQEADYLGLATTTKAGYDPKALTAFFKQLLIEQRVNPTGVPAYMLSHPVTEDRVAHAESVVKSRGLETPKGRPLASPEFLEAKAVAMALDGPADAVIASYRRRAEEKPDDAERQFLSRAAQVLLERDRFFRDVETASPAESRSLASSGPEPVASSGWYSWFWGGDIQLIFWQRLPSGQVLGVELNRSRFVSDVVGALPSEEELPAGLGQDRVRLVDSRGETLHQWGAHEPADGARPAVELQLAPPLAPWRLQCFPAGTALDESLARQLTLQLILGLSAFGLVLAGLAAYFIRESARDLREARQRVSFANQVSHELKTPLTNIRMYAELLQGSLGDGVEPAERAEGEAGRDGAASARETKLHEYADVIAAESQRLSRLIGNILTFARMERDALRLRRRPHVADETISAAIERFRPALESQGIEARFTAGAPRRVSLDPDALEQILSNLLSNVEKYAPRSGTVEVSSSQDGPTMRVVVADRGPGIPAKHVEDVFVPFRRLSDRLAEGVSGTGLGLSIARDLARLHGGDVRLLPSASGARFEVVIDTGAPEDAAPGEGT